MSSDTLDIRTTWIADTLYVALTGELDMDSVEELAPVQLSLKEASIAAVELDLTGLAFLDSIGLLQITRLYRLTRGREAALTVHVREGSHVHQILRLIGAGDLFAVVTQPERTAFPS